MIKAVIFDCFGVIRPDNLLMTYSKFGGDPEKDAEFIKDTIGASNRGLIPNSRSVFAKHLGVSVDDWTVELSNAGNDQELLDFALSLRVKYKVGLLSNISGGRLIELFEPGELERYFDATVASAEIGFAKPEPEAYEIIADKLGVRLDECVFTDDNEDYCEGARAVGMQAILYKDFEQFKDKLKEVIVG